jgi:hypothetical protein
VLEIAQSTPYLRLALSVPIDRGRGQQPQYVLHVAGYRHPGTSNLLFERHPQPMGFGSGEEVIAEIYLNPERSTQDGVGVLNISDVAT